MMLRVATVACVLHLWAVHSAQSDVQVFDDEELWMDASTAYSTITFADYPEGTVITDQYEDLGVTFTTGDDAILFGVSAFPDDHFGLHAGFDNSIEIQFDYDVHTIGVLFPGALIIEIYSGDELLADMGFNQAGVTSFGGYISDAPISHAVMYDPTGFTAIDDLMFGPPIPAPGALPLLGLALLAHQRRRRR